MSETKTRIDVDKYSLAILQAMYPCKVVSAQKGNLQKPTKAQYTTNQILHLIEWKLIRPASEPDGIPEDDQIYYFELTPDGRAIVEFHKKLSLEKFWFKIIPLAISIIALLISIATALFNAFPVANTIEFLTRFKINNQ